MKILQLTKKYPYPLKDGEAIAITYLAQALNELGCELTLLSMNTTKHFREEGISEELHHYREQHLVKVDNRVKVGEAFLNLFSKESYHIARFVSTAYNNQLIELLENNTYDIVQLETLYLAPYIETIRAHSSAKIVMRSHNVEHEIWKRITENTSVGPKKIYLQLLTKRLEQFELEALNQYDLLAAITDRDLEFFKQCGCKIPTKVTPIGLETGNYVPVTLANQMNTVPTFCFIGSLDWMPNYNGVKWILDEVWDAVVEAVPQATFHIAGRNTPEELLQKKYPNVVIHGEVEDALDFINAHDAMLVPLFSGSGMRVKILEGMALEKVIISTQLGLEGIAAKDQKEVLIADTKEMFIQQIINLLKATAIDRKNIGIAARQYIMQHFDNIQIGKNLLECYQSLK
jgi:glycosyltransferase involved in cell wall biosynthesis